MISRVLVGSALALLLSGCVAGLGETHHFATIDPASGEVFNVFRLKVSGTAGMANARYVSGFYDERAVDVFFNEVKAADLTGDGTKRGADRIFKTNCDGIADAAACEALRGKQLATISVGGNADEHGAFVLILSTNADAVAGTIGSFAENEATTRAALFLATRNTREADAELSAATPFVEAERAAIIGQVDALMAAKDPPAGATDGAAVAHRRAIYLSVLRTVAAGLQPDAPPAFTNYDEARAWFAAQPRGSRQ